MQNANVKFESKHDFTAKLRQPSLLPNLKNYLDWQRLVRGANANGGKLPEVPDWLMPVSINLDLTTGCNYRCVHCIDADILNGTSHNHETLMASLENMINCGLRSVIIIGGGEPTLYAKFENVVRFLKERGVQVAIVSNGSRNNVILNVIDCLDEKDWVRFSLDAGTNNTFTKMHRPRKIITLDEICSWAPRIRNRNPKVPLGFSFLITWEGSKNSNGTNIIPNIGEIVEATRLAYEHEFNYISFKPFLVRQNDAEVMNPETMLEFERTVANIKSAIDEAKSFEKDGFKVIESTNLKVLEQNTWRNFTCQPKTCHIQAFRQVFTPIGLFNCPGYRGIEKARINGANAYKNQEEMQKARNKTAYLLNNFNANSECANVTCLFNQANHWIEENIGNGHNLKPSIESHDYYF
ncbi:MAG: radical SAM protein [Candidatus Paceibacterota bacterium]